MVKITYTNGDVQHVKVTADFFTVTVAEKNGNLKYKWTPYEKAETLALDLAQGKGLKVAEVAVTFPGQEKPKVKIFAPIETREPDEEDLAKPTKSFLKELKKMKKKGREDEKAGKFQRWTWTF